jgi:hypothetical protein
LSFTITDGRRGLTIPINELVRWQSIAAATPEGSLRLFRVVRLP